MPAGERRHEAEAHLLRVPETRKPRDECTMMYGEEKCAAQIEAHKACLRAEGFNV